MRIRIRETVLEGYDVEVPDGLTGKKLQKAVEKARSKYEGDAARLATVTWDWESDEKE